MGERRPRKRLPRVVHVPLREGFVDVSGTSLFVREWGELGAPCLLFWHGLGATGLQFNEAGPILAGGYGLRVVAPDAPGCGRSPASSVTSTRPSALAALSEALLDELEVERVVAAGQSWGGGIACHVAARIPARTAGLVLLDGGYLDVCDFPGFDTGCALETRIAEAEALHRRFRFATWDAYLAATRRNVRRWTPEVSEAFASRMHERGSVIEQVLAPAVFAAAQHASASEPTVETFSAFGSRVPVLTLVPTEPCELEGLRTRCLERLRFAAAELAVERLPGCGHDVLADAGPAAAHSIGAWLLEEWILL